jgi:AcrR family transcriptional regulator
MRHSVTDQAFTRRTSYGPTSPTVGSRGARTRQQIVEAALQCFREKGFHATAVEDIATLAETSRATLYQYFESKDAIFIELMYESGGELVRLLDELGPLGPSREGFASLQRWLADFAGVFDRYSSMFVEWANVNSPKAALRPKLARFVDFHAERFGEQLRTGGFPADDAATAAIMVLAVVGRFHYVRHVYRPGLTQRQLHQSLSVAIQLYLFPTTPDKVLASAGATASDADVERAPIADIGPLASLPRRNTIKVPAPFKGLSPQSASTVRELLDAAARVFASNGYAATNIDQIVTEADLARGTFYRYFSDKLELITALAWEAAAEMCPLFDRLPAAVADRSQLEAWLHEFLDIHRRYTGVMRAWSEGYPIEPQLLTPAADVIASMSVAITSTFGPPRPYPLDRRAAGMLLVGALEHFPNETSGCANEPTAEQIVDAQRQFLCNVLLPRRAG